MSPDAKTLMARTVSERKQLQPWVYALAQALGYLCYHTHNSSHSAEGFPDIVAIRGVRLIAAELKRETAEPTADQIAWLEAFAGVGEAYIWRPSDWLSGRIERIFLGEEGAPDGK